MGFRFLTSGLLSYTPAPFELQSLLLPGCRIRCPYVSSGILCPGWRGVASFTAVPTAQSVLSFQADPLPPAYFLSKADEFGGISELYGVPHHHGRTREASSSTYLTVFLESYADACACVAVSTQSKAAGLPGCCHGWAEREDGSLCKVRSTKGLGLGG